MNHVVFHVMKAWGVEAWLHLFLTSVIDGGERSAARPGHLALGKDLPVGGPAYPRAGLGPSEKRKTLLAPLPLSGIELRLQVCSIRKRVPVLTELSPYRIVTNNNAPYGCH